MRKVTPNGAAIKLLREELEKGSTQKEFAFEIGMGVRTLRLIENENASVTMETLSRLANALAVHREQIVFALDKPKLVSSEDTDPAISLPGETEDQLIPRHDYEYAQTTMDEGHLFKAANSSAELAYHLEISLNEETGEYAQELFDILVGLTWTMRSTLDVVPATEEIAIRRRIRQLLVLLKGNDIWVYETKHYRRLPERHDLPQPDTKSTTSSCIVVTLGPPGEYGETSMRVPIDHGQPFILPSWKSLREKRGI
jgi:transcriptional regulator with XRE-family HTH domain